MNKHTRTHTLQLCAVASALAAGLASAATVVTPVSVTQTVGIPNAPSTAVGNLLADVDGNTYYSLQNPLGTLVDLPTGTNLTIALATVAELSNNGWRESWSSNTGQNPVAVFDLTGGVDTEIASILLWQFGNSGATDQQTQDFSLMFHTAAEGNDFSTWSTEFSDTLAQVSGSHVNNIAQQFTFAGVEDVRYVALRIDTNYGGSRDGLGEVRFAVVPEPQSNAALLALGGLALILRRRVK